MTITLTAFQLSCGLLVLVVLVGFALGVSDTGSGAFGMPGYRGCFGALLLFGGLVALAALIAGHSL